MSKHLTIIGAGPAGSMLSILLARQGHPVPAYESRPDMRITDISAGRSINLALATRGIEALKAIGVMEEVEPSLIPMYGRMIHDEDGQTSLQTYGSRPHEYINSVSRTALNSVLLDAAEATGRVTIHFDMRCRGVDFDQNLLTFTRGEETVEVPFVMVFGTDGSASAVRESVLEANGGQLTLEPLVHGYKELTLPAGPHGEFLIERAALHIWPHKDFMLIALPDPDGSFTVTIYLPVEGPGNTFEQLVTDEQVTDFFAQHFADFAAMAPDLTAQFAANPLGLLATVRTTGWAFQDRAVLLGDASHGVVPFHGQGMNAAFESCIELDRFLKEHPDDWATAFAAFEQSRKPDTDAIADMAVDNYVEMSTSVVDEHYVLKRSLALEMEKRWPETFVPRYGMVMFSTVPYAVAQSRARAQGKILDQLTAGIATVDEVCWETAAALVADLEPLPS